MSETANHRLGIVLASVLAGPVFLLTAGLADLYLRIPAPIVVDAQSVWLLIGLCVPATVFGTIVAAPINGIGALAMMALGGGWPPARTRTAWALAGGLTGGALVWLFAPAAHVGFALIATSTFCAWLSRGSYDGTRTG